MSAPGVIRHHNGNAPDLTGANATNLIFNRIVQSISVRNVDAIGGSDMRVSFDNFQGYTTLGPRESYSIENVRLMNVQLGGVGGVVPYEIIVVEQ